MRRGLPRFRQFGSWNSQSWITLAIVLGILLLIVGTVYDRSRSRLSDDQLMLIDGEQSTSERSGRPTQAAQSGVEPATFAVLGDSYSTGAGAGPGEGWVDAFASGMCWSLLENSSQGGTGYTTRGLDDIPGFAPFPQRVSLVASPTPEIVLVEGGSNDVLADSKAVTDAAAATFRALREKLASTASIVAIGPVAMPKGDESELARASAAIRAAASDVGVMFIDPIAENWLDNPSYFGADGLHPNVHGYREYSRRLQTSLEQLGVQASTSCKTPESEPQPSEVPPNRGGIDNEEHDAREAKEVRPGVP